LETKIILPNKLEAGAVIPQCLDNHYIPDDLFFYMIENKLSYKEPVVQEQRNKATRTELNRTLVYAPQIIINRAFLWNNRVLYSSYKDTKENLNNRESFIKLLKDKAIIPYLHDKSDIQDPPDFDLDPEGVNTFQSLFRDIDQIQCLRFDRNDGKNQQAIDRMEQKFVDYFLGFSARKSSLLRQTADGLINGRNSLERINKVNELTDSLISWKSDLHTKIGELIDNDGTLKRNFLYKAFLCDPEKENSVTSGYFLNAKRNQFILEKKKLIDLRYNTNLADNLHRYTFTPADMPARSALAIDVDLGYGKGDELIEFLSDNIKHTFMEGVQGALNLPLLKDLTMEDIYELRHLPGWAEYIAVQRNILNSPLKCIDYIDEFAKYLGEYNVSITNWYKSQKRRPVEEQKYRMIVRIAIRIAGIWIAYNLTNDVFAAVSAALIDIPDNALGYTVSLMIDFLPIGQSEVSRELGYTLDIVNYDVDVTKENLLRLINKTKEQSKKDSPNIVNNLANQSKNS
jgi:hypothetical protein